jgi:hypothetical protein
MRGSLSNQLLRRDPLLLDLSHQPREPSSGRYIPLARARSSAAYSTNCFHVLRRRVPDQSSLCRRSQETKTRVPTSLHPRPHRSRHLPNQSHALGEPTSAIAVWCRADRHGSQHGIPTRGETRKAEAPNPQSRRSEARGGDSPVADEPFRRNAAGNRSGGRRTWPRTPCPCPRRARGTVGRGVDAEVHVVRDELEDRCSRCTRWKCWATRPGRVPAPRGRTTLANGQVLDEGNNELFVVSARK